MTDPAKAGFADRMCAKEDDDLQEKEKLTTYCQVETNLIATFGIDYMVAYFEAVIPSLQQQEFWSAVK